MQPYLFPYIGYFQLISAVDKFVIYDNIEYTKKGWINRNRILLNRKSDCFTIPLKKNSDYALIIERELADNRKKEINKTINKIKNSYSKAPYFNEVFPMIENIFNYDELNLFNYIEFSLNQITSYLDINTEMILSSKIKVNHNLKSEKKVIAICEALGAKYYINPIGGEELYSKKIFRNNNIELSFLKSGMISYKQFDNDFVPWLSIIDVLMFNSKETMQVYLNEYSLK